MTALPTGTRTSSAASAPPKPKRSSPPSSRARSSTKIRSMAPHRSPRQCRHRESAESQPRAAAGGPEDPPPQVPAHLPEGRNRHHAAPVPHRRKRIPAERQALPPARHPGHLHGHRPRPGELRHHRPGAHRAAAELEAPRPPRHHRRSRRHHALQDQEAPRRTAPRIRQAEPGPR